MNITVDRELTLCISRWLRPASAQPRLPILMYHSISNEEESAAPYYRLATSPERFAEQMQWLKESGYAGTSLEVGLRFADSTLPSGRLPVAITFDDGYRNFYTKAWPILRRCGFTATMYLPTGSIGSERQSLQGRASLTWAEVGELHSFGIHFGSHTVSHPLLQNLSRAAVESELRISKQDIEDKLGHEVTGFAYPYAFPQEDRAFSQFLRARLSEIGYETCVTTIIGRVGSADDRLRLRRLPVNSCDDRDLFLAKLQGCYDWVGWAQRAVRHLKRFYR